MLEQALNWKNDVNWLHSPGPRGHNVRFPRGMVKLLTLPGAYHKLVPRP